MIYNMTYHIIQKIVNMTKNVFNLGLLKLYCLPPKCFLNVSYALSDKRYFLSCSFIIRYMFVLYIEWKQQHNNINDIHTSCQENNSKPSHLQHWLRDSPAPSRGTSARCTHSQHLPHSSYKVEYLKGYVLIQYDVCCSAQRHSCC